MTYKKEQDSFFYRELRNRFYLEMERFIEKLKTSPKNDPKMKRIFLRLKIFWIEEVVPAAFRAQAFANKDDQEINRIFNVENRW